MTRFTEGQKVQHTLTGTVGIFRKSVEIISMYGTQYEIEVKNRLEYWYTDETIAYNFTPSSD